MDASSEQLARLAHVSELLMDYVHLSKDYDRVLHNYGLKEAFGQEIQFNHMEIHMLSAINEHPGISAQELATMFYRTKGAVSQIVKFLAQEGLIIKQENAQNARINNLYTTERGQVACKNHADHENAVFQCLLPAFDDYSPEDFSKLEKAVTIFLNYFKESILKREKEN